MKLTYDDFLLFPDDGMRRELIDGETKVTRDGTLEFVSRASSGRS
jgi:hypothetical protein